jgi:hypothetical protein
MQSLFKSCLAIVTISFYSANLKHVYAWSPKHNMHIILLNYNSLVYIITQGEHSFPA